MAQERVTDPTARAAVRRWMASSGSGPVDDCLTVLRVEGRDDALGDAVGSVRDAGEALSIADLAVGGEELLAAGIPSGPAIGAVLRHLLEQVLEDPSLNRKETLLALIADPSFHLSRFTFHASESQDAP